MAWLKATASWVFLGLGLTSGIPLVMKAVDAYAAAQEQAGPLTYVTDKAVYTQGEIVWITVTNVADAPQAIVDRTHVDGGFATIEIQTEDAHWRHIELYAVANVTTFRMLKPGEGYQYLWQTIGYNHADTAAVPGTYRISFGQPVYTNLFRIQAN
ncbi:MAG TPA: hypothetical protein VEI04_09300 [Syntrophobacteria bacterium]|nr:hypothetical protein [Syntrophobacteria bacterium]